MGEAPRGIGISAALASAALFGLSTPLAKLLLGEGVHPVMLAGLLYAGSGFGLSAWLLLRIRRGAETLGVTRSNRLWLGLAITFGGIIAPVLLVWGLDRTPAITAALLLNLEIVMTAALAWLVFREHFDRRIIFGMVLIFFGGVLLTWQREAGPGDALGPLAIVGACLCWALDNNFTRKISAMDAVSLAAMKGVTAGIVNIALCLVLGLSVPSLSLATKAGLVGLLGYGVSLVLFIIALRHLGASRTGAYFAAAPFIGAAAAIVLLNEQPGLTFLPAVLLMSAGVWLHLTEKHAHMHDHEPIEHSHPHEHDDHHQHPHDLADSVRTPHTHMHRHAPMRHAHRHFPDLHHRHTH